MPTERHAGAAVLAAALAVGCQVEMPGSRRTGAAGSAAPAAALEPNPAYDEGVEWARKAETAPLPTPPPLASPPPKGAVLPPAPEFKPEEIQAVGAFERASASRPNDPRPHLALAQLLSPHAVQRHQADEQAAWRKPVRGRKAPSPPPTPDPAGIDFSPDRIVRSYQAAIENDPASKAPVEALIDFAVRVKRLDAAELALQELVRRVKESPEPFVRYGDFLLEAKKDPEAAIEQYRQALIWKPDDEATRGKLAGIYIDMGAAAYGQKQYAIAQSRFADAAKYVTDKTSPQGQRVQDYLSRLREIRGR